MNEKKKQISTQKFPANALEVIPDSVLQFSLTRSATSLKNERAVMTLCHSGRTSEAIAFKVKTTQPRRYLVRPNQGIIMPGRKESVTILIVDKDRQILLDKYNKHGKSSTLVNSKDKFLVQSCIVDIEFAQKVFSLGESSALFTESGVMVSKETTEALTDMWSKTAGESSSLIYNKKLQVQHVICSSFITSNGVVSTESNDNFKKSESNLNHPIYSAISGTNTRFKSDNLISPNSNTNNERVFLKDDPKKNKKDLRKVTVTSSIVNNNDKNANTFEPTLIGVSNVKSGIPYHTMILIATLFFFIGIKASNIQKFTDVLSKIPAFGNFLGIDRKEGIGQEL